MKEVIIPDIHDKVDLAQKIMDKEKGVDRIVLLGDYFDSWTGDVKAATHSAEKVKSWVKDYRITKLLGNHDQSYWLGPSDPWHLCSGYSVAKKDAIWSVLSADDWNNLHLHTWVQGWLVSHAGFDVSFLGYAPGEYMTKAIDDVCDMTIRKAAERPVVLTSTRLPLLGAGYSRGGRQKVGGITWCHWDELNTPDGLMQLVGHTRGEEVRYKYSHGAMPSTVCLDTDLSHYGVVEDGILTVKETAGI